MKRCIYFLVSILLLLACTHHSNNQPSSGVKKEIPTYLWGQVDRFYQLAKDRQNQLGLDSIEEGFHDLQIRVWYNLPPEKEQQLVVIEKKDSSWQATRYHFTIKQSGKAETIISKTATNVSPLAGWPAFSKQLLDLQILTLPNQDDVEGYAADTGGTTYYVETATKNHYRFYGYWEPEHYKNSIWQAKNMAGIIQLIEKELSPAY